MRGSLPRSDRTKAGELKPDRPLTARIPWWSGGVNDAVIAHQGQWLGGDTFLSFDCQAVALLQQRGINPVLLR